VAAVQEVGTPTTVDGLYDLYDLQGQAEELLDP
jgi:hypothetical protein